MAWSSLGCRNLTKPNPTPRRMTSRLKCGVSGPQAALSAVIDGTAADDGDVGVSAHAARRTTDAARPMVPVTLIRPPQIERDGRWRAASDWPSPDLSRPGPLSL